MIKKTYITLLGLLFSACSLASDFPMNYSIAMQIRNLHVPSNFAALTSTYGFPKFTVSAPPYIRNTIPLSFLKNPSNVGIAFFPGSIWNGQPTDYSIGYGNPFISPSKWPYPSAGMFSPDNDFYMTVLVSVQDFVHPFIYPVMLGIYTADHSCSGLPNISQLYWRFSYNWPQGKSQLQVVTDLTINPPDSISPQYYYGALSNCQIKIN